LDPTDPDDPLKLVFNDDGRVAPDPDLDEAAQSQVKFAIEYLGLSQSQLDGGRRKTWRDCTRKIAKYSRIAKKHKGERTVEECETLLELRNELIAMSKSSSEFSAAARCCLTVNRLPAFILCDELAPLAVDV